MAVKLYDTETGEQRATISEEQLQLLIDLLEEETLIDRDYYFEAATLEYLERNGADPELLSVLRSALAGRDGAELRWEREQEADAD